MPTYEIQTTCEATCHETWRITLPAGERTRDELHDAIWEALSAGDAVLEAESVDSEGDREIVRGPKLIADQRDADTAEMNDAARDWLVESADGADDDVQAIYASMSPQTIHARVGDRYPANTPGQDGWSSFCEDWAAGTLAPARRADALDAATGQSRR